MKDIQTSVSRTLFVRHVNLCTVTVHQEQISMAEIGFFCTIHQAVLVNALYKMSHQLRLTFLHLLPNKGLLILIGTKTCTIYSLVSVSLYRSKYWWKVVKTKILLSDSNHARVSLYLY
jgi:hypothetical protein